MEPKMTTKQLASAAMGIALITVCSWISVPTAVPFTMQTFAICLISALFGLKPALCTVGGYILLGAIGVPVFSGFRGGPGVLLGTTGGYIIGFLLTAAAVGFTVRKRGRKRAALFLSMSAGILLCYAFGTVWFMIVYTRKTGAISLGTALSWCVIPFLIPDGLKALLAAGLAGRLYPILKKGNLISYD